MRIAISSSGETADSQVDPRFGRAAFFMVVDMTTGAFEAHNNVQNLNAVQGAGIQAARHVADLGVDAVLTGHVGPKAFIALQAAGVTIFVGASGTVRQALEQHKAGQLAEAAEATVEGTLDVECLPKGERMPGGDGTGPMGMGPRMGRGRGMCAGRDAAGLGNQLRQGRRGRSWQCQGMGWQAPGEPSAGDTRQELPILQQQAQAMAAALESLRTRIEQLQGHKPTD